MAVDAGAAGRARGRIRGAPSEVWDRPLAATPPAQAGPRRFLYLYSGDAVREDSLGQFLVAWGIETDMVDKVNVGAVDSDLADDALWRRWRAKLKDGVYHGLGASPPCGTFCGARKLQPGPPVLRSAAHPYGFPKGSPEAKRLRPEHFEDIRIGNLLAERAAEAALIMQQLGRPYWVEQPEHPESEPCMFQFRSFQQLVQGGAKSVQFDQCMHGSAATKPTTLLYQFCDASVLAGRCNHAKRWVQAPGGEWLWKAHPPIVGAAGKKRTEWPTKALAAYPEDLNRGLAGVVAPPMLEAAS